MGLAGKAQSSESLIRQYLEAHSQSLSLSRGDVTGWSITDQHTSRQSGVTHVYIRQEWDGIPVANGVANFAIRDQNVLHMGNRLVSGLERKSLPTSPVLRPEDAVLAVARFLGMSEPLELKVLTSITPREIIFSPGGISLEEIPVRLMYHAVTDDDIRLVWDMSIATTDSRHWWSIRVDAITGDVVFQNNWILECNFEDVPGEACGHTHTVSPATESSSLTGTLNLSGNYTVYPLPVESPSHGARATVVNPADPIASPFGWHDTDGNEGAEFTITRGNNVYAYDDRDDDNDPGYSPDGTGALNFTFPLFSGDHPTAYLDGAITNLFYMNNMIHDILYQYGFDEVSGNFQENNYGLGGFGEDYVRAEAQDGGGMNNANFGTPPDGDRPRMQMYIWTAEKPLGNYFDVTSPDSLAGPYESTFAAYGPAIVYSAIEGEIVVIEDHIVPASDGCDSIINADQLAGKLVMIDRGGCPFLDKTQAAQDAGAIGVIFVSTLPGSPTQIVGTSATITIPSIMISKADGDRIKAQLALGPVTGSIHHDGTYDSSLDNGIIAHEYGHGISNRLTGGPNNTDCLDNAEQMGEGWSDFFALMLTMEPGDRGEDIRGIATYAKGQTTTGPGIRPAPYSTSFDVNPYTYGDSNNEAEISRPHGVGFIFASALWDLNWALIDAYGGSHDPDLIAGTGGNNITMKLVMEALKLQPCHPGMIDGRDAILLADQVLYDGAHQCLIWDVFARRGFGYSASQGNEDSRSDQVEAFDIPTVCLVATESPVAAFSIAYATGCSGTIVFTDESSSVPQSWFWDFGDGITSAERNPVHTYMSSEVYTVQLIVTNTIGTDTITLDVEPFALPPAPMTPDVEVCAGDTTFVLSTAKGLAIWRNENLEVIQTGDTLWVPVVTDPLTFYVEDQVSGITEFVGPPDRNNAAGDYHGTGYFGATNFTAERECRIVSAWVDGEGDGPRTFILARGTNTDGEYPHDSLIIEQFTLEVADGEQRVSFDLLIPGPGDYTLGASLTESSALFRNSNGVSYPYSIPGFITLTSSSANNSPLRYYYYLYDLEVVVRDEPCVSARDTFTVSPVISAFTYVENGLAVEFYDESVGAVSWHWDFGDGYTSDEQNPVHMYTEPDDYIVSLTINNGACTSTQLYSLMTGLSTGDKQSAALSLSPNPAKERTILQTDPPAQEPLRVTISDCHGRVIRSVTWPAGQTSLALDVADLSSGLYFIHVTGSTFMGTTRLMVD